MIYKKLYFLYFFLLFLCEKYPKHAKNLNVIIHTGGSFSLTIKQKIIIVAQNKCELIIISMIISSLYIYIVSKRQENLKLIQISYHLVQNTWKTKL